MKSEFQIRKKIEALRDLMESNTSHVWTNHDNGFKLALDWVLED